MKGTTHTTQANRKRGHLNFIRVFEVVLQTGLRGVLFDFLPHALVEQLLARADVLLIGFEGMGGIRLDHCHMNGAIFVRGSWQMDSARLKRIQVLASHAAHDPLVLYAFDATYGGVVTC